MLSKLTSSLFSTPPKELSPLDKLKKMMPEDKEHSFADQLEDLLASRKDDGELHAILGELCEQDFIWQNKTIKEDVLKAVIFYRKALELLEDKSPLRKFVYSRLKKIHDLVFHAGPIFDSNALFYVRNRFSTSDFAAILYHCSIALSTYTATDTHTATVAKKNIAALTRNHPDQLEKLSVEDRKLKPDLFRM